MDNFLSLLGKNDQTPIKQIGKQQRMNNSSRGFSSSKRHRNPIFPNSSFSSTGKKQTPTLKIFDQQPTQHYEFPRIINDDFCSCENTLTTCERITRNYFKNISLSQLKFEYQKQPKIQYPIDIAVKKFYLTLLPANYPEIYNTHLINLLGNFESIEMNNQSFLLLAWIHFHCKLEYITFFFYQDLMATLREKYDFTYLIDVCLIKENVSLSEEIRHYEGLHLKIRQFITEFYQSAGAIVIPISQYAKFLQIVKFKGIKALVDLICLFIGRKRSEFFQILKYWTHRQTSALFNYSRFLNWDLFFQQVQIME